MDTWFVLEIDGVDEAALNARLAAHGLRIHRDEDADVVCLIGVNETPPTYDDMMIGAAEVRAHMKLLDKLADLYFDTGMVTYREAYVLATDEIKTRYRRRYGKRLWFYREKRSKK